MWSSRNRARRRERGDLLRACLFGAVGLVVFGALFEGSFWLTGQLEDYEELGDYLLRLGLSWLFLTFLSFLAFSGVVTALSTFFLSEDLRLLLDGAGGHAAAVSRALPAHGRAGVVDGRDLSRAGADGCRGARAAPGSAFYAMAVLTVVPFAVIPVAAGTR